MKFSPIIFGLVYLCGYIAALATDGALFVYYPQSSQFAWGWQRLTDVGPGITWYGLMGSAAVVALAAAFVIPGEKLANAMRSSLWLVPLAAMVACVYLMRHFFFR